MVRFKGLCAALILVLGFSQRVQAEGVVKAEDYKPYPHWFFGLHGGAQTTLTDYNALKLATPVYGASLGGYFTPVVGTRLHVSGYQNKGGVRTVDETYEYKYVAGDLDLMLNLTNLFAPNRQHIFNVVLLGGVGLNYAWDNNDLLALNSAGKTNYTQGWTDNLLSHNARVGMLFDLNLAKHFSLNLELTANSLSDKYNSKTSSRNDWQMTASLGLVYKFGFKKKALDQVQVMESEEIWETRVDTVWYDDITYKDVPVTEKLESCIYYEISKSGPQPQAKIDEIVAFVKSHKDCKITVTGYADKGTGNAQINMKYARERSKNVVDALIKAGIDKNLISSDAKGDTVQPFSENDKNRVSITVVSGKGVKKEKVVIRKFRTEEKRYRIQ